MKVTLTSKGQVTIPKDVREKLQLETGDKLEFLLHEDGRLELLPITSSYANYLIAHKNKQAGCLSTITFDKKASKHRFFQTL